jgi:hypothetical protein
MCDLFLTFIIGKKHKFLEKCQAKRISEQKVLENKLMINKTIQNDCIQIILHCVGCSAILFSTVDCK